MMVYIYIEHLKTSIYNGLGFSFWFYDFLDYQLFGWAGLCHRSNNNWSKNGFPCWRMEVCGQFP